ncbi:50S ribosomal protein L29 [bacterium]|nr:50S ribosomal protein L29 [bacterium]
MARKSQLWAMGVDELTNQENDLTKELFNLRFQKATGQIQNPLRLRTARRERARVITIRKQKEAKRSDG